MAGIKFLGGQYLNHLARSAPITPLTVTDENSLFPKANIYDGRPGKPFRFNTAGATMQITADLNLVKEGGFESAFVSGLPSGWVKVGTPTVTQESSPVHGGTKSVSLKDGSGAEGIYYDMLALPGQQMRADMWARSETGSATAQIILQNQQTGKYLKNDGTWQSVLTALLSTTSTTYQNIPLTFNVESFLTCLAREVTLRLFLRTSGVTDKAIYDDVYLWPTVNFSSIHGHTIAPVVTVQVRSSTDNFGASDVLDATLTPAQISFYGSPSSVRRYWRLSLGNANPGGAIWLGEWVLGQSVTLLRNQEYGWRTAFMDPQLRDETDAGEMRASLLTEGQRRRLELSFQYNTIASMQEARDTIVRLTRNGAYPCVIVPDDSNAEVVIFGKLSNPDQTWSVDQDFLAHWSGSRMVFEESPLFTVLP